VRFEFLGTGTSAGIPALGCECPVCTSDDPRDRRLRTSAMLRWTDDNGHERGVLIDCGPDFRQQALRARVRRLDAILFTHNHVDHTFGLDEVRRYNAVQRAPIDIYGEEHTLGFLRRVYAHIFDPANNLNDSFVADVVAHEVKPGVPVDLHGVRFTPVRLLHGNLPVVGFRIEEAAERLGGGRTRGGAVLPLMYCTDVSAIPPGAWPQLRGVRTLVLNALRHRPHPTHFTVAQAIEAARRIGAERTYFVHMSHDLAHGATQAALPEGMSLAYDGLVLGGDE
jgi:phosphoribosyl 1,2-cyclic phosphate phosphodiesterase